MIPRRIEVEGFLCYRTRQVITLDGADLWVFSGRNGSGKSAIFDAITFALYGAHRGGKQGKDNLINVHAAGLEVVFEFDLGPDTYRITRTLRRGGEPTRQVCRREVEDGVEYWTPVAETDKKAGLERWVSAEVGLNEEMFTTATLLRQGKSDRFLEATAKVRFDIVAEVADMRPYQTLHDRADARRKERKIELNQLQTCLQAEPPVDPAAPAEAEERLATAERCRGEEAAERDRLVGLEGESRRWASLIADHEAASRDAEQARRVIASALEVEGDWRRLGELDAVLPILAAEQRRRTGLAERETTLVGLGQRRTALGHQAAKYRALADEAEARFAAIDEEINRAEARQSAIRVEMRDLAAPLRRFEMSRTFREQIAALEDGLARYPIDLAAQADRHAEGVRRCVEWQTALSHLAALAHARAGLVQAHALVQAAVGAVAAAETHAEVAADGCLPARATAVECRLDQESADRRRVEAQTIQSTWRDRSAAFERLRGASACDSCGQPLTPEHRAAEVHRLRIEQAAADRAHSAALAAFEVARARREAADAAEAQAEQLHRDAADQKVAAHRSLDRAERDVEHRRDTCAAAFAMLDESFQAAVRPDPAVDWAATTYPTPTDLAEGRRIIKGLDEANRSAREVREQLEAQRGDQRQLAAVHRALAAIGLLPADAAAAARQAQLHAEDEQLASCLRSHRRDRVDAETAIDALAQKLAAVVQEQAVIPVQLKAAADWIEAARQDSAAARCSIPAGWLAAFDGAAAAELAGWHLEQGELQARDLGSRIEALPTARRGLDRAVDRLAAFAAQLEAISKDACVAPTVISTRKRRVDARLESAEADVRACRRHRDDLGRKLVERAEREARKLILERELNVADRLTELLGRGKLQRTLIRDAERGILESSNQVLRTISGDDLELRLAGNEADDEQALTLEVIDRTHGAGRTLGVAFLSGSQRFRVAVSLAVGIGQYARGYDRPIRSVIIDEGFGSLDRQGRDEMIGQLKALRGCLDRIVLVSHQDEFADAFPDGYRFRVEDDHTVIEEFHH